MGILEYMCVWVNTFLLILPTKTSTLPETNSSHHAICWFFGKNKHYSSSVSGLINYLLKTWNPTLLYYLNYILSFRFKPTFDGWTHHDSLTWLHTTNVAAKARKGLGSFGGIANGDSLTAKASWGFGVTFPKREARNRDEYIYIYIFFVKMKRFKHLQVSCGSKKHICQNYTTICIHIYIYNIIISKAGLVPFVNLDGLPKYVYFGCICILRCQWIVRIQKRPMTGILRS